MATTVNTESGSKEHKGDHRTADSDAKYPLKVLYCGGMMRVYSVLHLAKLNLQIYR